MDISTTKRFLEKRKLLDAPDCSARDKVKQHLSKVIWSACGILIFTSPGFFADWKALHLQALHWVFFICSPITYVIFGHEIYKAWRIKRWFDQTGTQSFQELSKLAV